MSQANYIIICRGLIDVLATNDPVEKIQRASACAAQLVSHIEVTSELPQSDAKEISALQHDMMDALKQRQLSKEQAEGMVDRMFVLLDALEEKVE